nr:uncharacterized protein LOC109151194 [Ipomoea batatas]
MKEMVTQQLKTMRAEMQTQMQVEMEAQLQAERARSNASSCYEAAQNPQTHRFRSVVHHTARHCILASFASRFTTTSQRYPFRCAGHLKIGGILIRSHCHLSVHPVTELSWEGLYKSSCSLRHAVAHGRVVDRCQRTKSRKKNGDRSNRKEEDGSGNRMEMKRNWPEPIPRHRHPPNPASPSPAVRCFWSLQLEALSPASPQKRKQ